MDCWVLAVLLGCMALLAGAPTALAAEGPGQISGMVTEVVSMEPIEGIEVCAYPMGSEPEGPFPEEGPSIKYCVQTETSGKYTIAELPSGEYHVEFLAPSKSPLDYVTQYYNNKPSFSDSKPVPVGPGAKVPEINAALVPGGEIKGTVTEAAFPHGGLQNIEVTVYEAGEKEFSVGSAATEANGAYTVKGLPEGSYKVGFSPGIEDLNYITQYYEGMSSLETAQSVGVKQDSATTAIDGELEVGGEISGTVTDASTRTPLSRVDVFALGSGEAFAGEARTNASGQYTIPGLASGSYKIEFIELGSGSAYIIQYYNNQPSPAGANPVSVTQGSTTPEINAALVPKMPANMAGPVASGTPAVGQTLSCSTGSWTGIPTLSYAYTWLRSGSAITGASASTYGVQAADQGAGLACQVTATNKYGSAAAVSNTLAVPVHPPPPPPTPVVTLLSIRIAASGSSARVPIACANANCTGTIELTERIVIRRRHHGETKTERETFVLARGSYALSAGHSATILVRLTHTGKHALARARHHGLSAKLLASVTGGLTVQRSVVLSETVAKHKRKHR